MFKGLGKMIEDVWFFYLWRKDLFAERIFVAKEDCMRFVQFMYLLGAYCFIKIDNLLSFIGWLIHLMGFCHEFYLSFLHVFYFFF